MFEQSSFWTLSCFKKGHFSNHNKKERAIAFVLDYSKKEDLAKILPFVVVKSINQVFAFFKNILFETKHVFYSNEYTISHFILKL